MTTKEKVKALWRSCFDDNKKPVETYFRLHYKSETNIAIESGDKIVSVLQVIPYPMIFCGDIAQTSHISGTRIRPDFRGNGVMRESLSQAFAKMLRNGAYFSTLTPVEPWLFDYYTRMGYASVLQYSVKGITIPEFTLFKEATVISEVGCQKEVYEYLNSRLSGRTCCIQYSFKDPQVVVADPTLSDGILVIVRSENQTNGLVIVYGKDKQLVISESLAETKDTEHSLLHHIKQLTERRRTTQLLPSEEEQTQYPLGTV